MFDQENLLRPYEGKKIVITGGAGFIGAALGNFLAGRSKVIAIDNLSSGSWDRCNPKIERKHLDISRCDESEIFEILEESDYLFHLAAVKKHNTSNSFETINLNNIFATERLFNLAVRAKVPRTIFTSSLYAYGSMGPSVMSESDRVDPLTHYGLSKLMGEQLMRIAFQQSGLSFVIPRLFFIYGPNQFAEGGYRSVIFKSFENIKNGKPVEVYGSGKQSLDYVYIEDCITSLLRLGLSEFQGVVNVSSSKSTTVEDVLNNINSITGSKSVLQSAADWTEGSHRVGNNSLLNEVTGYMPQTTILEGLQRTWDWMKEVKN
jgi:UDP-glucose 4-epimerase